MRSVGLSPSAVRVGREELDVTGNTIAIAFGLAGTWMGGIGEVHMIPTAWHD